MRKSLPLLTALAACLMTPAVAQSQGRSSGGYAGVGVMTVSTENARDFGAVFATSGDGSATGLKVYGGYLWPSRFGVEVGYYDLGTYEVRTGTAKSDEFQTSAITVSGVYSAPLGANFDFSAKLGIAFTSADYTCVTGCRGIFISTSKSGTAGVLGAGVGLRLAPNFSLRADYEYFGGVTHSVGGLEADYGYGALSLSGQLKF
jgi:hypothetical protein